MVLGEGCNGLSMTWKSTALAVIVIAGSFSWQSQRGLIVLDGGQALTAAAEVQTPNSTLDPSDFTAGSPGGAPSLAGFSPRIGGRSDSPANGFVPTTIAPDNGDSVRPSADSTAPDSDRIGSRIIEAPTAPEQAPGLGLGTPVPSTGLVDAGFTGDANGSGSAGLGGGGSGFGLVPQPPGGGFLFPTDDPDEGTAITPPDPTSPVVSAVPEPSTWAMLILGFFVVGVGMRRAVRKDSHSFTSS